MPWIAVASPMRMWNSPKSKWWAVHVKPGLGLTRLREAPVMWGPGNTARSQSTGGKAAEADQGGGGDAKQRRYLIARSDSHPAILPLARSGAVVSDFALHRAPLVPLYSGIMSISVCTLGSPLCRGTLAAVWPRHGPSRSGIFWELGPFGFSVLHDHGLHPLSIIEQFRARVPTQG
jgi:hypothetical protein